MGFCFGYVLMCMYKPFVLLKKNHATDCGSILEGVHGRTSTHCWYLFVKIQNKENLNLVSSRFLLKISSMWPLPKCDFVISHIPIAPQNVSQNTDTEDLLFQGNSPLKCDCLHLYSCSVKFM